MLQTKTSKFMYAFYLTLLFLVLIVNGNKAFGCEEETRKQWLTTKVAINNLVAQPIGDQPIPPTYERFCLNEPNYENRDSSQDSQKEIWLENYLKTEKNLLKLSVEKGKQWILCGGNADEVASHLNKLSEFMGNSALRLAFQVENSKNLDFFIPVAQALIQTAKINGINGTGKDIPLLEKAASLFNQVVEDMIAKIKIDHDFRYSINAIVKFTKLAEFLGFPIDINNIFEKYSKAMTFDITLDNQTHLEDLVWHSVNNNNGFELAKSIHLELTPKPHWSPFPLLFQLDFEAEVEDGEMTHTPDFFNSEYWINIKACEPKPIVEVYLRQFGPEEEKFTVCDDDGECHNLPLPGGLHSLTLANLKDQYIPVERFGVPFYRFEAPLTNFQLQLTDETYEGSFEDGTESEYKINLIHTPK